MEITTKWSIKSTDYEIESGRILRIHYGVDTTDGVRKYHTYGTAAIVGRVVVPFKAITEALLIDWVKDTLGEAEVDAIEKTHMAKMEVQEDVSEGQYGRGLPWGNQEQGPGINEV